MKPTLAEIREVLKVFLDSDLQDLRLEIGDVRIAVSRNGAAPAGAPGSSAPAPAIAVAASAPAAPVPSPARAPASADGASTSPAAEAGWVCIKAPSLGVFYRRPAPDQPPFVEVGDTLEKDAPVCLIEVMKMYHRVGMPCRGRIARIMVDDGNMVEFGQALVYVEPA